MQEIIWTNDLNSSTYRDALRIRYEVFVNEQQVPEDLEIDELEDSSAHLVLYQNEEPVGTARVFHLGTGVYKMQRVAVLKKFRGQGLGAALIRECEAEVRRLSGQEITLGAQTHAIKFYERLGYVARGEEFMDAGIPHYEMTKKIAIDK